MSAGATRSKVREVRRVREGREWRNELGSVVSCAGSRLSAWRLVRRPSAAAAAESEPESVLMPHSSLKQVRLPAGKLLRTIGLQNMESVLNCCRY